MVAYKLNHPDNESDKMESDGGNKLETINQLKQHDFDSKLITVF